MPEEPTVRRYNDKFQDTITDADRDILMGNNVPIPLILNILSIVLKDSSSIQLKKSIRQNIVTNATSGGEILPLSKIFQQAVYDNREVEIPEMLNGRPNDYLSIFCGIIEGCYSYSEVNKGDKVSIPTFIDTLGNIATKELKSSPNITDGLNAIDVIRQRLAVNAKLPVPQKLGGSGFMSGWVKVA